MTTYPMQIDGSTGSNTLIEPLAALSNGQAIKSNLVLLGADVAWTGHGPDGLVSVGLEYKTVWDLIESICTDRLGASQIPLMVDNYDVRYLLVEGSYRRGADGNIEVEQFPGKWVTLRRGKAGHVAYSYVSRFMKSCYHQAGFWELRTLSKTGTVHEIHECWSWWQKEWAAHDSLAGIYAPVLGGPVRFRKPNFVAQCAFPLPGIGSLLAHRVGAHFKTVADMVNAPSSEWAKIEGIGKQLSTRLPKLLQTSGGVS
jgi:ERCC4-type nuclease